MTREHVSTRAGGTSARTATTGEWPPPAHLDDGTAAVWREIVTAHHDPARIVGPDLEAYAAQVALMRDARARITKDGAVVKDARGQPIAHPAIAIERDAGKEIRAWGDKFKARPGRTPRTERTR